VKIVKEINGVLCLDPEQEFYHLMHIPPPPFLSVSFFIPPFSTPAPKPFLWNHPLSFQFVIVQNACCMRVENFITALLYRLTTQTHNSEGHASPFVIPIQFPPGPQYNYLFFLPDSKKMFTWLNFQFTGIHMWNRMIIWRKRSDKLISCESWIFRTLCAFVLSQLNI